MIEYKAAFEMISIATSIIIAVAYIPQILVSYKDNGSASSTSVLAFSLWAIASLANCAYAVSVNGDAFYILYSVIHALGCSAIFIIAGYKKYAASRRVGMAVAASLPQRQVSHHGE